VPQDRCDAHEVVRDDPKTNPSTDASGSTVATPSEPMATFEHTDSSFAAHAPALATPKPALPFMRAPRRGFATGLWQHDAADAPGVRSRLVGRRRKAAITRGEVGRPAEYLLMTFERRHPECLVRRPALMNLVRRHDLMLAS
jgi:hypothetical protein